MAGPKENIQFKRSQMTGKGYFDIGFCKDSKYVVNSVK